MMTAAVSTEQAYRSSTLRSDFVSPLSTIMPYDLHDRRMSSANEGLYTPTTLMLRRLPLSTTTEAVKTMLLFAKDLQDAEIVPNDYEDDAGFATAVARFSSVTGASEAQLMLDGKPNTEGHANMIVELRPLTSYIQGGRRNTLDPTAARPVQQPASPRGLIGRYNGPFDPLNKLSPPPATSPPEGPLSEGSNSFAGMYQPQSPRGVPLPDRGRVSGKSVIGEEDGDEETNGLIQDPLGYMKKDNSSARRSNGHQPPMAAFNKLSLRTEMPMPQPPAYLTPRTAMQAYSPRTPFSAGPGSGSYLGGAGPQYPRTHQFPPVNPADQNPPCNTLYVGNLPMDTSEDELKAMFSKQRGYKRLCFRTKQNGPMCFVEFEDISFATKALNELYGAQLHNSVKGGIRLSFSKNPLGVRSGQPGSSTGPPTPLSAPNANMLNGLTPMSPGGFQTANGPPPGLAAPPGFAPSSANVGNQYHGLGMRNYGQGPNTEGNMYPDYMMGR